MATRLALLCCVCVVVLRAPPVAGAGDSRLWTGTDGGGAGQPVPGDGVAFTGHPRERSAAGVGDGRESNGVRGASEVSGFGTDWGSGEDTEEVLLPADTGQPSGHEGGTTPITADVETAVSWDMALDALLSLVKTSADATAGPRLAQLKAQLNAIGADVLRGSELAANTTAAVRHLLDGQARLTDCHRRLQDLLTGQEAILGLRTLLRDLQTDHGLLKLALQQVNETLTAHQSRTGSDLSALHAGQTQSQESLAQLQEGQTQLQEGQTQLQEGQTQLQSLMTDVQELRSGQTRLLALLEAAQQQQVTSPQPAAAECPAGWSRSGASCFLIPPEQASWYQASRACALIDRRSQLASVHPDTTQHVHQLFKTGDARDFWIGLARQAGSPGWGWSDGSQLDYTKWRPGEPNNSGGAENCVHEYVPPGTTEQGWNDRDCSIVSAFLCEIRLD